MCPPLADSLLPLPYLPALVFVAELCVVTLSTLRIIFIARGKKLLAPAVGFFEVAIWLFAIGQVMQNLSDPGCFLGFAGGFTLGNYLGMLTERWLALGTVSVRTVTHRDATGLIRELQAARFGVTSLDAEGARGPVKVVLTVVPRRELDAVLLRIRAFDPQAFFSVDDVQQAGPGIFPERKRLRGLLPSVLQLSRRVA
jgi:uncharacterized protein YebE (UPF0316 family)